MILEQIKNPDFFNNSEQNMIYFLQNNLKYLLQKAIPT